MVKVYKLQQRLLIKTSTTTIQGDGQTTGINLLKLQQHNNKARDTIS
jgi:hypothetical protein